MLLCGKPDCLHDNDKCNAYLGKGDYLPFTLYYYDHFLYALKMGSSGNAVLVQISEDGTSRKEICELLPAYRSNNIDLSFHDGKVYAYSHVMETRASEKTNTEYDALILCADLSTGKVETAHTYRGLNAVIQKGRCYSKLRPQRHLGIRTTIFLRVFSVQLVNFPHKALHYLIIQIGREILKDLLFSVSYAPRGIRSFRPSSCQQRIFLSGTFLVLIHLQQQDPQSTDSLHFFDAHFLKRLLLIFKRS